MIKVFLFCLSLVASAATAAPLQPDENAQPRRISSHLGAPVLSEAENATPDSNATAAQASSQIGTLANPGSTTPKFRGPFQNCQVLEEAAATHDVPLDFFIRLIKQESNFNPNSVSHKGAQGIAQFMPGTARWRGLADPFEPIQALFESRDGCGSCASNSAISAWRPPPIMPGRAVFRTGWPGVAACPRKRGPMFASSPADPRKNGRAVRSRTGSIRSRCCPAAKWPGAFHRNHAPSRLKKRPMRPRRPIGDHGVFNSQATGQRPKRCLITNSFKNDFPACWETVHRRSSKAEWQVTGQRPGTWSGWPNPRAIAPTSFAHGSNRLEAAVSCSGTNRSGPDQPLLNFSLYVKHFTAKLDNRATYG